MKRLIILVLLIVNRFAVYSHAQEVLRTSLVSPLTYELREGKLCALTAIILSDKTDSKHTFALDGQPLPTQATSRPDSLLAWLPLVGKQNFLNSLSGGKVVSSFCVTAPISDDWGFFQKGEIHLLQASHQDIAWMDTPEACRKDRIDNIIIPALEMMKSDPDITFEMEQTLNLMEFLEEHPERKVEVIQRYKEGRFLWGATYNQPYEGLSSGEQLVRQTYYGRKWIKDNLPGCDDFTASNMDVPGRAMQMPQILAKSGVKNLFISRMREGLYDWSSPDGSSVLTYSLGHYGWEKYIWHFFDRGVVNAFQKVQDRLALWEEYYTEHHLPPLYAVLMSSDASKPDSYSELIKAWNDIVSKSPAPLPRLVYSTTDRFLSAINTPHSRREQISGERPNLWLYIHGPAHYDQTLDKRRASVLLPAAEFFSSLNYLSGELYPEAELDRGWMASIYPDHGLGGKNGEITDAIYADSLAVGRRIGQSVLQRSIDLIAADVKGVKGDIVLFNDLTWERTEVVDVPITKPDIFILDSQRNPIPSQTVQYNDSVFLRFLATVPSMGYARYSVRRGKKPQPNMPEDVKFGTNYYSNAFYDIRLGAGGIVSLYDKQLRKEILAKERFALGDIIDVGYEGNGAGEFTRIKDLTIPWGAMKKLSNYPANWRIIDEGPVFVTYENVVPTDFTTVRQRITVYHQLKKIDFDVSLIDFTGEHNRQYRILFPVNMKLSQSDVCYEVPMAVSHVEKDELKMKPGGYSNEGSYLHHPTDTHPREILNFISTNNKELGFTMSSCVAVGDWIDPSIEVADYPILQGILLSSHKSCHGEGNWYHQTGTHHYHFSVITHPSGWQNGYGRGVGENHPFHVSIKQDGKGTRPALQSFLTVSDPLVSISTMKKAAHSDAIILRLVEMEGKDKDFTVQLPFKPKSLSRCNMLEEKQEPLPCTGNTLQLHIGHNAIETLIVER